jgi:hypothetical protein
VCGQFAGMPQKRKQLNWTLPPEIEARLGESSYGRQRVIAEADHILIILHMPPVSGTMEREPALFLRKPDGSFLANGYDNGGHKLRELLARYRTYWEECDKAYDTAVNAEELLLLLEKLAPLNRSSTNLRDTLQAARDAAKQDRFLIEMRDESYDISRAFDLLTSDAKLKLDYRIAKNSEEQAAQAQQMTSAQHRLNVLAAITFPIMAVATVLGMNLRHGFENQSPLYFMVVLVSGVVIGMFVKRWVAR